MMSKNVLIPLSLLDQIIELLKQWEISEYWPALRYDYDNVFWSLIEKKQKLILRDAYTKIIQAKDPQAKGEAYILYLQEQCRLHEAQVNIPF